MHFEDCSELTTHVTRIAGNLSDDVAFEFDVIAWLVERDAHAATGSFGGDY